MMTMEIKDNGLLRQFESQTDEGLLVLEYATQERKVFLTKMHYPDNTDDETLNAFICEVLKTIQERKQRVVPTHPKVAHYFRKNPACKELLPPGIRL